MKYFKLGAFDCERILLTVLLGTAALGTTQATSHHVAAAEEVSKTAPAATTLTDTQALNQVITANAQPLTNSGGIGAVTQLTQQSAQLQRIATPQVRAETPTPQADFNINFNTTTQTATITGFADGVDLTAIVIPDTVTNAGVTYPVTEIGQNAFIGHSNLTSVVMGANVTSIDAGAFGYCDQLANVDFSNNHVLTTVGDNSFVESAMTTLTLPDTVSTIGYQAFAISNDLKAVNLPSSLTSLGANAFIYSKDLTTVTVPAGLQVIPSQAFASCPSLTTVNFPTNSQLTTIGAAAFIYDAELTGFAFPDSLETIGNQAFLGNTSLATVAFGPSLQTIGSQAFMYDTGIKSADFTKATALVNIDDYAFEYDNLTGDLVLPNSLKNIGTEAFLGNQLTGVDLNTGLTTIGDGAFAFNSLAKTLTVPATVTSIGNRGFQGNQIASVDLLSPNVALGTEVFRYNRVTSFNANQITDNGSIGQQNEATIFTDPAHVGISDLFDINANDQQHLEEKLQISNITNGVTYANNTFVVPTGTTNFSFQWDSNYQGTDLYSGQYNVVLNNPDIKVIDTQIPAGSSWAPIDNFVSAQLADGTPLDLSQLTVSIVDPNGNQVNTINTLVAGNNKVTYTYGNDSATANVLVYMRDSTYKITGTQTSTYNGSAQTPNLTNYTVDLVEDGTTYTLQPGDLELAGGDASATNAGTYQVVLSQAGIDHLTESSSETELSNWTMAPDSSATLVIDKAAASYYLTGTQTVPYNGQVQQPDHTDYYLVKSTGGNYTDFANSDVISSDEATMQNAGTYPVSLSATAISTFMAANDGANYDWQLNSADQDATFVIDPARVTVTANNASKYTGQSDPNLSATISYQDPVTAGTMLNYTVTRASGETAGTYPITVNLGTNPNYQVTTVPGTFTINQSQQSITASDYTMYVGDPEPTLADFKASATAADGQPETVNLDLSQADYTKPGSYTVTLTTNDGQLKTVTLNVLANLASFTAQNVEMYQNGTKPTLADFKATATDKTGATVAVTSADFSQVNYDQVGTYPVVLTAADGRTLTKSLTVLENKQSLTAADYEMYVGDPTPTATDFQAVATDQAGNPETVNVDLSQADLTTPGTYPVVLTTSDNQTKTVNLTVLKNQASITASDVTMYQHQTPPTLADFKATATDKTGAPIAVTSADFSQVNYDQLGTYPVVLTAADGQTTTAKLTILANQQSISGANYTMYVGDSEPTVTDFQATATNAAGDPETVYLDLSKVDFQTPGTYGVELSTADDQTKTVSLTILANQQSITGADYTMYVGDPEPTVTSFQASATNKAGEAETVSADLGNVDFEKPGDYEIVLYTNDGQTKTVTLHLLANQQSISVQPYAMHVGQPAATLADFKAKATDKDGQAIAVTMDASQVNYSQPGTYDVKFTATDGQTATTTLTLAASLQTITGADYTMYVGAPEPTAANFAASATDVNGQAVTVTPDLSQVNFTEPGSYAVTLRSSDGQTKAVTLHLLANEKSITGQDYTMYVGDPEPTLADFQASAKDENGNTIQVTADLGGANLQQPGTYPVVLTASDGQTMTVQLHVLANQTAIHGYDFTMYVGDATPTAADFHATATDKTGQELPVNVDLSMVNLAAAGTYPVLLTASDGQTLQVALQLLANQQSMTAKDYTMTLGDSQPTVADFQAVAVDKTGNVAEMISLDFSRVNFNQVGQYPVTLTASDGQTRTVILTIVAKPVTPPTKPVKPTTPTKPTSPTSPTTPTTPVTPNTRTTTTPSTTKSAETPVILPKTNGQVTTDQSTATKSTAKTLPATSEKVNNDLTFVGSILAFLASFFGFIDLRRRRDRD